MLLGSKGCYHLNRLYLINTDYVQRRSCVQTARPHSFSFLLPPQHSPKVVPLTWSSPAFNSLPRPALSRSCRRLSESRATSRLPPGSPYPGALRELPRVTVLAGARAEATAGLEARIAAATQAVL